MRGVHAHRYPTAPSTLTMMRLLSSKAEGCKDFRKPSKPCYAYIHWIALAEYSEMSITISQGFSDFPELFSASF